MNITDPFDFDHDRERRTGFPEVIYGQSKTPDEITTALLSIADRSGRALATRVDGDHGAEIAASVPQAQWHERCRCISVERTVLPRQGQVAVICAGTSDLAVAQEAQLTADLAGANTELVADAGVAGIHRILAHDELLRSSNALVVVAGMEGALPSVVAGRVSVPVIAVPTSVGYGASLGGIAALLGMLCSCAPGISVVNIDNGFGAGIIASRINRLACQGGIAGES
ncbi:MAG: nickel pincer cofactor biosynthesis protein LarB [Planctomycetota bacterium]|nr:1-(5-phosphoribosyl)-5-amino-4-imidazole-carboxylate carboxylase [Planctomycetota bacterium]MEE2882834.1 nickel pincer cofactor biosynthesis protein LarB [Planctomycetota bacterium]